MPPEGQLDLRNVLVLDLTRFRIPETVTSSRWSCTNCGGEHDPEQSWALTFDTVRGPRVAVVCPDCAEDLRS